MQFFMQQMQNSKSNYATSELRATRVDLEIDNKGDCSAVGTKARMST